MDKINELRDKIDLLDDEIMSLLDKRLSLGIKIGNQKSISKTSILDTKREQFILNKTSKCSHSPEIDDIYKLIMNKSKLLQRK